MHRIPKLIFIAAALIAAAFAQHPFGVLTSDSSPDPATIVQNRVERLISRLTLTTAQAAQATTIFTNALNAITPLEINLRTAHDALPAAVKANNTATIDQLSSTIGSLEGQILAIQNKADAAFYAILTVDQKSKLDQTGFGGLGGPGGFGPGPGHPGRGR